MSKHRKKRGLSKFGKPVPPEVLERMRKNAKAGRIVFAPSDGVESYGDDVLDGLMRCLGIEPPYFVSDESSMHDFGDGEEDVYAKLSAAYGVEVNEKDHPLVLDVLRALYPVASSRTKQ